MTDSRVKDFFKNTDMTKQRQSQKDFITMVKSKKSKNVYFEYFYFNLGYRWPKQI
jgi:hypothetical protein